MPPRYAFWTILIDQQPTAFRARDREELLPTLVQLQRKHPGAHMKWFAHGRLWDSPEQQQWAQKHRRELNEKRGADWRPGGAHKDPRAKFRKPKDRRRPPRDAAHDRAGFETRAPRKDRSRFEARGPRTDRPRFDSRGARQDRPPFKSPRPRRPWQARPRKPKPDPDET